MLDAACITSDMFMANDTSICTSPRKGQTQETCNNYRPYIVFPITGPWGPSQKLISNASAPIRIKLTTKLSECKAPSQHPTYIIQGGATLHTEYM